MKMVTQIVVPKVYWYWVVLLWVNLRRRKISHPPYSLVSRGIPLVLTPFSAYKCLGGGCEQIAVSVGCGKIRHIDLLGSVGDRDINA